MRIYRMFLAAALFAAPSLRAQTLDYEAFIAKVKECNIDYIVEKFNVDIATANVQAARVFNDPELSLGYSNNQDWNLQMGQGAEAELSYNFSLGNVRKARIGVARTEKELSEAAVEDYFRNLRADATVCWLDAWQKKQTTELMRSSYEQMNELARSDSMRYAVGEITQTDAMQSHLEAQTMYNDFLRSRTEYVNALTTLGALMGGGGTADVGNAPEWQLSERSLADLFDLAEASRADLKVAERVKTLSERNLKLVRANRAMELGVSAGYNYNTEVRNELAPAPKFHGFTVGVSVPLKFSSFNKGEKRAAQYAVQQSEAAYEAVSVQLRSEVTQAQSTYATAREVLGRYDSSILSDAEAVLKNKTYGYLRGETNLLEVLTARRTYNDVYQGYIDARFNERAAGVELRRAVGVWDF